MLLLLGMTAAASTTDAIIQKKIFGSELKISNEEIKDILEIVKNTKESGLLVKGVTETIKNEVKTKRWNSWHVTLAASLFSNMLAGKGVARGGDGVIRAGERQDF